MAKSKNQKVKLLKILEILQKNTDENHSISTNELIEKLGEQEINCERKTIYTDIQSLIDNGYEIFSEMKNHAKHYYITNRKFDLVEIKILLDAVQSANFITPTKTKVLTDKLADETSLFNKQMLTQKYVQYDTLKHSNEKVYYSIDRVLEAINQNKKISFAYFVHNVDGSKRYKKEDRYFVSPLFLTFSEGNYYLTAFDDAHKDARNYRLDKMEYVEIEKAERNSQAENFANKDQFAKQGFSMFRGESKKVSMVVKNDLVDYVMDKFGENVKRVPYGDDSFQIDVSVPDSPTFYSWCMSFGEKIKVLAPQSVVEELKSKIETLQNLYK